MKSRFHRRKRRSIGSWPEAADSPDELAERVEYVGSPEHKDHPSPLGAPRLRSDATPCEVHMTRRCKREHGGSPGGHPAEVRELDLRRRLPEVCVDLGQRGFVRGSSHQRS